ncbi:MAG: hypothetical protein ACRCU2_04100, partial [Planktothrix sp.]
KEFADAVKGGTKTQAMIKTRKAPIKVKDTLYLYCGFPRGKTCELIKETICQSVVDIEVNDIGILLNDQYLTPSECYRLAIAEGFDSIMDLLHYFKGSFKGQLIKW